MIVFTSGIRGTEMWQLSKMLSITTAFKVKFYTSCISATRTLGPKRHVNYNVTTNYKCQYFWDLTAVQNVINYKWQLLLKSIFMLIVSQQHVPQVQKDMSITMEQNIFITRNVNLFWNRETYFWDLTFVQNVINLQLFKVNFYACCISATHISVPKRHVN
jgi:hypothetical protein